MNSGRHKTNDDETQEMRTQCSAKLCKWEEQGDTWLKSKALQMGGVLAGLSLATAISFFVYISGLETRVRLLEENRKEFTEIRQELKADIKEIKADLMQIKIQISKMEKDRTQ